MKRDLESSEGMFSFVRLKTNHFLKFTALNKTEASFAKSRNFERNGESSSEESGKAQPLLPGFWPVPSVPFGVGKICT